MSRLPVANRGSLVSIAGLSVPRGCSKLEINYQDLSDPDAGRSMDGTMWKGYFGTIRTLECTWNALYPDHISAVLKAVRGKNSFPVEFYDPESESYVTSDFYAGDRSTDIKQFYRNGELIGLKMNIIEVSPYYV